MKRPAAALASVLIAAACSGSSTATTEGSATTAPVPTSATPTTMLPPDTETPAPVQNQEVLDSFVGALNQGEVETALALLDSAARWQIAGFDLVMDEPLPADLAWLAAAFGLPADRTGLDVIRILLTIQVDLRTVSTLTDCEPAGEAIQCSYGTVDVLTPITGRAETGELTAEIRNGLIVAASFETREITVPDRMDGRDSFLRWAYVQEPSLALQGGFPPQVDLLLDLLDEWVAVGMPDVLPPEPVDDDPVAVVTAWLRARDAGDWTTHVSLLAGIALEQELGSRDDFEAHALLEREIRLDACEVTLSTERVGVVLACVAIVEDIITRVVGESATNPNRTSLQVKDGRISSLPEFIPSHARAEIAIEDWAAPNLPGKYAAACPDGISNPIGVESRACAQFITDHTAEWSGPVQDAYAS